MKMIDEAFEFALNAHDGQRRKSDTKKPMIIHPMNVANILNEYGFDENVIAAGYLHDTVEDTPVTFENIKEKFGDDIASLVYGASEPDKSLSWEERKQHTIDTIKTLDLRHKAIICADKISNLEDMRILFEIKGEYDFSAFKRGFDSQKWYYTEVYKNLIEGEDNHPMFERLKTLIDYIFENKRGDEFLINNVFENNLDEYKRLKRLHYKKEEISKLRTFVDTEPYVIEFTGTPRTGKTTLINNLNDFFKKGKFRVDVVEEFTTSKHYKENIYPKIKNESKKFINTEIPKYVLADLTSSLHKNPDIIIIDRSLFDRLIWLDRLCLKDGISKEEYVELRDKYIRFIKDYYDIIIGTYTDPITALKRDYKANLSLEERRFLNETNINEFNTSFLNLEKVAKRDDVNFKMFDTTNITQRELSFNVCETILNDMKSKLIDKVNDKKELKRKI
ncbi:MAG: HD domain-containing protein [Bacilli bacterium]|nr:HD domain-containing protein [Bacilli bacterium]